MDLSVGKPRRRPERDGEVRGRGELRLLAERRELPAGHEVHALRVREGLRQLRHPIKREVVAIDLRRRRRRCRRCLQRTEN